MVPKLNNSLFFLLVIFLLPSFGLAQEKVRDSENDYKDKKQFEKFNKRRAAIAAWQINQLKDGALVVRLKTNGLLINSLIKSGDTIQAKAKQLETAGINKNTMRAYLYSYTFSKVYFIYSNSADSLFKGISKDIFLDTNLVIDPAIKMKETFYLLAERDYSFNSTIGFVKEDSARFVKEEGYGTKEMAVVVKNKYGHQLKKPFPYFSPDRPDYKITSTYVAYINVNGKSIPFNISMGKQNSVGGRKKTFSGTTGEYNYCGVPLTLYIPRHLTYERLSISISNFDEELKTFYRQSPRIEKDKINPELLPFLY